MKLLPIALLALCASCVTSADLLRISDKLAVVERSGGPAAVEDLRAEIQLVAGDVEERTFDWAEIAAGVLGTVVLGAGAAVPVVNRARDARRVARGEAT